MPKQEQPITHRPKVEDESTGRGSEHHGVHRQEDEALSGRGSTKGGTNRDAARDRAGKPTRGARQGSS